MALHTQFPVTDLSSRHPVSAVVAGVPDGEWGASLRVHRAAGGWRALLSLVRCACSRRPRTRTVKQLNQVGGRVKRRGCGATHSTGGGVHADDLRVRVRVSQQIYDASQVLGWLGCWCWMKRCVWCRESL